MRTILLFAVALLVTSPVLAQQQMPADLAAYVEEIKAMGMTEDAASSLRTVAAIEAGATVLTFERDQKTGAINGHGLSTKYCMRPGMSEEALAQLREDSRKATQETERVVERFKVIADRDGSGFVSSKEGWKVRELYFFGRAVLEVTADGLRDGTAVAKLLQREPEAVRSMLADYEGYREAFPALPALTFGEASARVEQP